MDRLSTSFVLGYHGCDTSTAKKVLDGKPFLSSDNIYDWLGPGIYFWEKNPERAYHFAEELAGSSLSKLKNPDAVGAVIDLGLCLDLTTKASIDQLRKAHKALMKMIETDGGPLPDNNQDGLRRNLDCAVIRMLHRIRKDAGDPPIDTVRGVFYEGKSIYPGTEIREKTHIQICVVNPKCIKGVFRIKRKS